MNRAEKLFKEKTKEISFLELKENSNILLNSKIIGSNLPLPIITDSLIKDIQESGNKEEINLGNVIDGIIFLIGIDGEFPHVEKYKEILTDYNSSIYDYVFYKGMTCMEKGELINAGIYFRSLIAMDYYNANGRFNYALVLEEVGKDYLSKDKVAEGEEFLEFSTKELETLIEIDKSYSLAYYKLGFHYKYKEQYLKASLIWNKFLILDKDENRLQEIRDEIHIIDDDVKFETGLTYLSFNDYPRALDEFLKLLPKYENNWNVNYLISKCYRGLNHIEMAIEYIEYAIQLEKDEPDLYNELGIIYITMGDIVKAIQVYDNGIENIEEDYRLYFNRGLAYLQLGQYKQALYDVSMAYEINPYDDNVAVQKEELELLVKEF